MTRQLLPVTFCFVWLIAGSAASAAEVTLPSTLDLLVDDPSDQNDDANAFITSPSGRFRFSDFVFSPVATMTTPPGQSDIRVSMTESARSVTLAFEFQANNSATGPGAYELLLEYLAEVIDPSLSFTEHTLTMGGTAEGEGSIFINEAVLTSGDEELGLVSTTLNVPNQPDTLSDSLAFTPTRTMTVHNKDISVSGGPDITVSGGPSGASSAALTRIEQTFQVIPEPSSLALLCLGGLGLGMARRRLHRT